LHSIKSPAPGLYLGKVQAGRFLPGKPLAHALGPGQANHVLEVETDDPRALRFAQGDHIEIEGLDGTYLVALKTLVGSVGLGWGKLKGGILRPGRTGL
jgi:NOL1/NOP2/fmu family ribosome biogenesis protein